MLGLDLIPNFNFHQKCDKLKITNLCFADDLLLFMRGDVESVKLMMSSFRHFSTETGLKSSIPKCKMYYGGVDYVTKMLIQEATGFVTGSMSFKNLRVPLAIRKLSITMCKPLIDKMLERLNHWSTGLLSYTGKMQLVKSVLFLIANYWMQIFPLPKKVINHIESIYRKFLWTIKDIHSKKAHISWDHICDPTSTGGRNIISLSNWNKATIGKLLWNVCAKKEKLWIRWIHLYYIKRRDVITFQPTTHSSLIIKLIFNHKEALKQ